MIKILPAWGLHSIRLHLPISKVVIDGLSEAQQRAIARDYGSFIFGGHDLLEETDVICCAGRLGQPLEIPPQRFSVNGQYTPLKRRLDDEVTITGIDFVGNFTLGKKLPGHALLAVAKEEEFAMVSVLENFLRVLLAYRALYRGGALLHSAGILYEDHVYLFCGRSNAGKTTLARKAAASGARVLSDDINLVIPEHDGFRAHRVPFTGEFGRRSENLSGTGSFPIGGLVLLEKAPTLIATPARPAEAVAGLLTGSPFVNDDPSELPALLDILSELLYHKPIIRMGVSRDDSFEMVMAEFIRNCENA